MRWLSVTQAAHCSVLLCRKHRGCFLRYQKSFWPLWALLPKLMGTSAWVGAGSLLLGPFRLPPACAHRLRAGRHVDVPQNFRHKDSLADETGDISTFLRPTEPWGDRLCAAKLVGEYKKKYMKKQQQNNGSAVGLSACLAF